MKVPKWIETAFVLIIVALGFYCGWWLVFLKPVIAIISSTALSWSSLGTCILRFFVGDIVAELIWTIGYIIDELVF